MSLMQIHNLPAMLRVTGRDLFTGELRPKWNTAANDAPVLCGDPNPFILKVVAWVHFARVRCEWAAIVTFEVVGEVISKVVIQKRVFSCGWAVCRGEGIYGSPCIISTQ